MDDEKYMLRKSMPGLLIKLDADIFYELLEYNFTLRRREDVPTAVSFWKKGVRWSDKRPVTLTHFIMKAKKGQIIDHINRNIFDNRRINLRTVNRRQNQINSVRRKSKIPFHGIHIQRRRRHNYWRAQYGPKENRKRLNFKFSVLGLFLSAVAHDKMIIENNEEDYAPLNFGMFKISAFKEILLNTDIKLLRRIYLGQKNENLRPTAEKTEPEKKNTVYKNQFFFDFRR